MYFTDPSEALAEVHNRLQRKAEIDEIVNENIESRYGVSDFIQKLEGHCSSVGEYGWLCPFDPTVPHGVLARQVPGASTEDVMHHLLCKKMGLVPFQFAFSRDCFYASGNDKLFRLKVPMIQWSKKGNMVLAYDHIVDCKRKYQSLDMMRMDRIITRDGISVAEYHQQMILDAFGSGNGHVYGDITALYSCILGEILKGGRKSGFSVWKDLGNGKDTQCNSYTHEETLSHTVRPCADWYYFMYLLMFLNGTLVLMETYDNDSGGVDKIRVKFERQMNIIKILTGLYPIVIKVPPLTPEMLYVNKHILEDSVSGLSNKIDEVELTGNTVDDGHLISKSVISYGKNLQ